MAHLEQGLFYYHYLLPEQSNVRYLVVNPQYFHNATTQECIKKAQQSTSLELTLTAAMGKRTKFQDFDTPQLFLHAVSNGLYLVSLAFSPF